MTALIQGRSGPSRLADVTASDELQVSVTTGSPAKMTDDAPFTPASSSVTPMGAYVDDTGTDSVDEGDVGAPRMSADRVLYITALLATDIIRAAGVNLTPKFAHANVAAGQTDAVLVAGVSTKKIRVLASYVHTGGTATNVTFNTKGAGAGTDISCTAANGSNGGGVRPFSPVGWFETVAGEALTVTTGAGSTTGIDVVYVEV